MLDPPIKGRLNEQYTGEITATPHQVIDLNKDERAQLGIKVVKPKQAQRKQEANKLLKGVLGLMTKPNDDDSS